MHSLSHIVHANCVAADRVRPVPRAESVTLRHRPPPVRGRVAYAVARMARRLDADVARRAVA